MDNDTKLFKLRLKLKSGEEFEAEGSLEFIEKQKEAFLSIVNKQKENDIKQNFSYEQKIIPIPQEAPQPYKSLPQADFTTAAQTNQSIDLHDLSRFGISPLPNDKFNQTMPPAAALPQTYRRADAEANNKYQPDYFGKKPSAYTERKAERKKNQNAETPIPKPEGSVWERIAYLEGENIVLRRKDKNLPASTAALIILGAAKILKQAEKISALELSKAMKLSGYLKGNERLDRILSSEIRESHLIFEGEKRNRVYSITQSGTAKAYTSAERILLNE